MKSLTNEEGVFSITESGLVEVSQGRPLGEGIITGIVIPLVESREALGAAWVARTPADRPIVNATAFVRLDEAYRVETGFAAVCGVSAYPVVNFYLEPLQDAVLDDDSLNRAVEYVKTRLHPVGDYRGSAEYRLEMACVVVRRALEDCRSQVSAEV
jgi:CO/xanthine dehydrogenase FAD-binding subunit